MALGVVFPAPPPSPDPHTPQHSSLGLGVALTLRPEPRGVLPKACWCHLLPVGQRRGPRPTCKTKDFILDARAAVAW